MRGAVIWERASSVERMHEGIALVANPRVPKPAGHPWRTRRTTVSTRAPRPNHRIPRVNRYRRRREKEPAIADHDRHRCAPYNSRA
jgi:hypothetical protein